MRCSKSKIVETLIEKGYVIQAPLNNGLDYVRIEMDEFVPADLDKLTKKMSYTKLLNNTQPINLDLGEMTTYRDSVKGLFTDTAKGSSICMRLFRVHRGGLDDSLSTAIYCKDGLKSIKEYAIDESFFLPPKATSLAELLHIDNKPIIDSRLPDWWGTIEFEVYMSHPSHGRVIVGYCNFRENQTFNTTAMNKELEKTEQNSANPIPDITPNSEVPDIIIGAKED